MQNIEELELMLKLAKLEELYKNLKKENNQLKGVVEEDYSDVGLVGI